MFVSAALPVQTMASRSLVQRFRVRELKRALAPGTTASSRSIEVTNPFLPYFNQETGRWAPPRYSLRRQAELVKRGRLEGNLHLLPLGPKSKPPENRITKPKRIVGTTKEASPGDKPTIDVRTRIKWIGEVRTREVPGADVGNRLYAGKKQMFKGHKWERVIKRRRYYQRILMRSMKRRILRWRLVRTSLSIHDLCADYISMGTASRPEKALALVQDRQRWLTESQETTFLIVLGILITKRFKIFPSRSTNYLVDRWQVR